MLAIRFKVWSKTATAAPDGVVTLQLLATGPAEVLGPGDPNGVIDLRLSQAAADELQLGQEYDCTIEPAPPSETQ